MIHEQQTTDQSVKAASFPGLLYRFVGGPVWAGGDVVADEDHAGAALRRRAGLPAHAQRGAEGVQPLLHQSLPHLLRPHVGLLHHQELTQRIVSQASTKLILFTHDTPLDGRKDQLEYIFLVVKQLNIYILYNRVDCSMGRNIKFVKSYCSTE